MAAKSNNVLKRTAGGLAVLERLTVASLLVALAFIVFLQVINRYLIAQMGVIGGYSEELARLFFVWMSFLGAFMLFRENGHFRIELLVDHLPPRAKAVAGIFADIVAAVFLIIMLTAFVPQAISNLDKLTESLRLPVTVLKSAITVSALLMLIYLGIKLYRGVRGPGGKSA